MRATTSIFLSDEKSVKKKMKKEHAESLFFTVYSVSPSRTTAGFGSNDAQHVSAARTISFSFIRVGGWEIFGQVDARECGPGRKHPLSNLVPYLHLRASVRNPRVT